MRVALISMTLLVGACGQDSVSTSATSPVGDEPESTAIVASDVSDEEFGGVVSSAQPQYAGPGEADFDDFETESPPASDGDAAPRYGLGLAKLPPPPARSCWTQAEFDRAMAGTGCDCSCDGFARQPDSQCQIACGLAYYPCWAPDPTDAEIRAQQEALFEDYDPETRAALEAQLQQATAEDPDAAGAQRAALMLTRATQWLDAQRCASDP